MVEFRRKQKEDAPETKTHEDNLPIPTALISPSEVRLHCNSACQVCMVENKQLTIPDLGRRIWRCDSCNTTFLCGLGLAWGLVDTPSGKKNAPKCPRCRRFVQEIEKTADGQELLLNADLLDAANAQRQPAVPAPTPRMQQTATTVMPLLRPTPSPAVQQTPSQRLPAQQTPQPFQRPSVWAAASPQPTSQAAPPQQQRQAVQSGHQPSPGLRSQDVKIDQFSISNQKEFPEQVTALPIAQKVRGAPIISTQGDTDDDEERERGEIFKYLQELESGDIESKTPTTTNEAHKSLFQEPSTTHVPSPEPAPPVGAPPSPQSFAPPPKRADPISPAPSPQSSAPPPRRADPISPPPASQSFAPPPRSVTTRPAAFPKAALTDIEKLSRHALNAALNTIGEVTSSLEKTSPQTPTPVSTPAFSEETSVPETHIAETTDNETAQDVLTMEEIHHRLMDIAHAIDNEQHEDALKQAEEIEQLLRSQHVSIQNEGFEVTEFTTSQSAQNAGIHKDSAVNIVQQAFQPVELPFDAPIYRPKMRLQWSTVKGEKRRKRLAFDFDQRIDAAADIAMVHGIDEALREENLRGMLVVINADSDEILAEFPADRFKNMQSMLDDLDEYENIPIKILHVIDPESPTLLFHRTP